MIDTSEMDTKGFAATYLRLCQRHGRKLVSALEPEPGEWALGPNGLALLGDPPRPLAGDEILIPRLDRLFRILSTEAEAVVIDLHQNEFACVAFDDKDRSLANTVERSPEEAVMRAILFIRAERQEQEIKLVGKGQLGA